LFRSHVVILSRKIASVPFALSTRAGLPMSGSYRA
jgi:hypothetical protein